MHKSTLFLLLLIASLVTSCDRSFSPKQSDPTLLPRIYEDEAIEVLRVEGNKVGARYDLSVLAISVGTIVHAPHSVLRGVLFSSPQKLTLEEGIALATTVESALLNAVYQNPIFAKYCESMNVVQKVDYHKISDSQVGIRVAFWDENVNRPLYPYLAEIRAFEGKIYCYYANPTTQALEEDPVIRSYAYTPPVLEIKN